MADERLVIRRIESEHIAVPIVGTTPLIVHRFSEKAKQTMLDTQQARKKPKERRDPDADYKAAFYRIAGDPVKYGFPAVGFKSAIVSAARFFGQSVKMTELRQFMFVKGILTDADPQPLVEIIGEPKMREDVVRLSMAKTDLRYRPEFTEWRAVLDIVFVKSALDRESVLSLVDAAGMGVGVGEWRPERKGDYGTFKLDEDREVVTISG